MTNRHGLDFSFSGLKTHTRTTIKEIENDKGSLSAKDVADVARAFEVAVVQTLLLKCKRALQQTGMKRLVIAGGVSANLRLRELLQTEMCDAGQRVFYAQLRYCTDNGAMIAYAGCQRLMAGQSDDLVINARPRWSLAYHKHLARAGAQG